MSPKNQFLFETDMRLEKNKIYNTKEIAEWFDINPATLSRHRDERLEELSHFADFECIGKRIKIIEVYCDTYDKHWNDTYGKIKRKIPEVWDESLLDSSKRVSLAIQNELMLPITERTAYKYTLQGRNELYGKPYGEPGELGRCIYTWCKKEGEGANAHLVYLTEEEQEIKQKLISKYFGDVSEKQVIVKAMVETGEISKEEAWDVLEELTNMKGQGNFMAFLAELQEKLHCMVIRGTVIEPNNLIEKKGFDWEE